MKKLILLPLLVAAACAPRFFLTPSQAGEAVSSVQTFVVNPATLPQTNNLVKSAVTGENLGGAAGLTETPLMSVANGSVNVNSEVLVPGNGLLIAALSNTVARAKGWEQSAGWFVPIDGGLIASNSPWKVALADNLYTRGAILVETPDHKVIQGGPVGLAYYCPISEQSVWIAQVTNCTWTQVTSNQIVFEGAFDQVKAGVRITIKHHGVSQDILLSDPKGLPDSLALGFTNAATVRLQVWSEFVETQEPQESGAVNGPDSFDRGLIFGANQMIPGKAFVEPGNSSLRRWLAPVGKSWRKMPDGRTFVVEEVSLESLSKLLRNLPQNQTQPQGSAITPEAQKARVQSLASFRPPPPLPKTKSTSKVEHHASLSHLSKPVVVVDWDLAADQDQDGLPDDWELYFFGNLNQGAQDHYNGDGLTLQEKFLRGCDPLNPDTDGDGLSDYAEIYTHGTDPTNPDTYGTGLGDLAAINPAGVLTAQKSASMVLTSQGEAALSPLGGGITPLSMVQNPPYYGAWECYQASTSNLSGVLWANTLDVYVGWPVNPPSLKYAPAFWNGQMRRTISASGTNGWQTQSVRYYPGPLYWSNSIPNPFDSPTTNTYTAMVDGAPSAIAGWWGAESNAQDRIFTNHGSLVNGASYATGKVGMAFSFNGTSSYVTVPNQALLQPVGPFSLEAWVYYTNVQNNTIAMKGDDTPGHDIEQDWALMIAANNKLRCHIQVNGNWNYFDCPALLSAGAWYHVGMAYDGYNLIGYINGTNAGVFTNLSGSNLVSELPLKLGIYRTGGSHPFAGRIDEFSFYTCALSESDMTAVYNAGGAGKWWAFAPLNTNAVGWWSGDSNTVDRVFTNNGTLTGGATYSNGIVGSAFKFDGNSAYVSVPNQTWLRPTGAFTAEAWINLASSKNHTVIAKGSGTGYNAQDWALLVLSNGKLRPHLQLNSQWIYWDCNTSLALNTWYHVAMVYNGTSLKGYVNGVLDGSTNVSGMVATSTSTLKLGLYSTPSNHALNGRVDEATFYNKALSDAEIAAAYLAGSAGKWWPGAPSGLSAGTNSPALLPPGCVCDAVTTTNGTLTISVTEPNRDWDGDGLTNRFEIDLGLNPLVPSTNSPAALNLQVFTPLETR